MGQVGFVAYDAIAMAFRVVRARLDGLRDGLLVFFVGVVLFRVAAAVDTFTNLLVAAAPVVMLASFVAVSTLLTPLRLKHTSCGAFAGT